MGFLDRLRAPIERRDALDNPAVPLNELLTSTGLFDESVTEIVVTPEKAMTVMAFLSCVRLLSNTIGMLDLLLYSRQGGSRTLVTDDPRSDLLLFEPNERDVAVTLWTYAMLCLCVWGIAYVWMETTPDGEIIALWPIKPTRIIVAKAPDGSKFWMVRNDDGSATALHTSEVMIFTVLGMDLGHAIAPYKVARQALGISKAAEEFAARTFSNGARPGGAIVPDKMVSDDQWQLIKDSWQAGHKGLKNAHNIALLPKGFDYKPVDYNPEPYQHIQAREFEVAEMGRMFNIPLHYLGIANANTTYASVDAQSLDFVNFTLGWYLKHIAQVVRKGMFRFPSDVARGLFVEHDTEPLLRTDAVSRAKIQAVQRMWALRTSNELREKDGEPPVEGGDRLVLAVTAAPLDKDGLFVEAPPKRLRGDDTSPVDDPQLNPPAEGANQPVAGDGDSPSPAADPLRDLDSIDVSVSHARRADTEE